VGSVPLLWTNLIFIFSGTHFATSRRHQGWGRSQTNGHDFGLSASRSAVDQAALSRNVQAEHRRLRDPQRQLQRERCVSVLFPHAQNGRGVWQRSSPNWTKHAYPRRRAGLRRQEEAFLGAERPRGKVRVDGISYEVIGILKHAVQNGDDDMNSKIYIPFSAMTTSKNTYYLNAIVMEYEGDHEKWPPRSGSRWRFITSSMRRTSARYLCST